MRIETRPSDVRRIVLQMFRRLGQSPECPCDVEEKVLIAAGGCAAWTYRIGNLMAMWMVEVGIVQFYDAEGNLVAMVNLLKELTPQQAAA
jgi:hypothetical protein